MSSFKQFQLNSNERQLIGPPGTGKTTTLRKYVADAARECGPDRVLVASFTKAAAHQLSCACSFGSGPLVNASTLHAIMYGALNQPLLAQSENSLQVWNSYYPDYQIDVSQRYGGYGDGFSVPRDGSGNWLQEVSRLRSNDISVEQWPDSLRRVWACWCEYKQATNSLDFVDLIQIGLRDFETAPGSPSVGIFDECQDLSPDEMSLVRQWGSHMARYTLAADPNQTIYGWKGAAPELLMHTQIAQENIEILRQSHRLPVSVYGFAESLLSCAVDYNRFDYRPRDAAGRVDTAYVSWRHCEELINELEQLVDYGKSAMVLAYSGHMLKPLMSEMLNRGIPFGNEYCPGSEEINPLKGDKYLASTIRLFLKTLWRHDSQGYHLDSWDPKEFWKISRHLKNDVWLPHGRAAVEAMAKHCSLSIHDDDDGRADSTSRLSKLGQHLCLDLLRIAEKCDDLDFCQIGKLLHPGAVKRLENQDLKWYFENIQHSARIKAAYPYDIIHRYGRDALYETPKITIGTIHSVKGGEADRVYVFPDLPSKAWEAYDEYGSKGQILRVFYVAATRAREELVLCAPCTRKYVTDMVDI